jgi:hypothetical protein
MDLIYQHPWFGKSNSKYKNYILSTKDFCIKNNIKYILDIKDKDKFVSQYQKDIYIFELAAQTPNLITWDCDLVPNKKLMEFLDTIKDDKPHFALANGQIDSSVIYVNKACDTFKRLISYSIVNNIIHSGAWERKVLRMLNKNDYGIIPNECYEHKFLTSQIKDKEKE